MRRFVFAICFLAVGCVSFPPAPPPSQAPRVSGDRLIARDGAPLGLSVWRAPAPRAVIIAVHGMNDYARSFASPAEWWAEHAGITTYAIDQRGFGRSPNFGRWPGTDALTADVIAAVQAIRNEHPGLPVYLLGHSMGAGVVIAAARRRVIDVDGVILAAPGLWGGSQLPLAYRLAANISAGVAPGKTLTGERAGRQATDNIAVLREMARDPLVIKETRLDSIVGVTRLMGEAYAATDEVGGRILFLYGEKDEIIPLRTMARAARRLCGDVDLRVYPEGWHMLFRDLQAERVWRDVATWVRSANGRAFKPFGPSDAACADDALRTGHRARAPGEADSAGVRGSHPMASGADQSIAGRPDRSSPTK